MKLYDQIFKRKSTRKYDMTPLGKETLNEILEYAGGVKPLDSGVKYEFSLLSCAEVKNLLPIKAPHYISIYSENTEHSLMNAGYILQQMDLYFSARGLGSCWLGMGKPARGIPLEKDGLDFVILIAFGTAAEPVYRNNTEEFKRKDIREITNISGAETLLEPVRIAPSASNSQPWFFGGTQDDIIVSRVKLGIVKSALYNKMNQIDIGIALRHLELSAQNLGKTVTYGFDRADVLSEYEFMIRVLCR